MRIIDTKQTILSLGALALASLATANELPTLEERLQQHVTRMKQIATPEEMAKFEPAAGYSFLVNPQQALVRELDAYLYYPDSEIADSYRRAFPLGGPDFSVWARPLPDAERFQVLTPGDGDVAEKFFETCEEGTILAVHYTPEFFPKLKVPSDFARLVEGSESRGELFKNPEYGLLPSGQELELALGEYQSWMPFYSYVGTYRGDENHLYFTLYVNCNPDSEHFGRIGLYVPMDENSYSIVLSEEASSVENIGQLVYELAVELMADESRTVAAGMFQALDNELSMDDL